MIRHVLAAAAALGAIAAAMPAQAVDYHVSTSAEPSYSLSFDLFFDENGPATQTGGITKATYSTGTGLFSLADSQLSSVTLGSFPIAPGADGGYNTLDVTIFDGMSSDRVELSVVSPGYLYSTRDLALNLPRIVMGQFGTLTFFTGGTQTSGVVRGIGIAAVPEPASWALMVGGFGLVGCAARRRPAVRVRYV